MRWEIINQKIGWAEEIISKYYFQDLIMHNAINSPSLCPLNIRIFSIRFRFLLIEYHILMPSAERPNHSQRQGICLIFLLKKKLLPF